MVYEALPTRAASKAATVAEARPRGSRPGTLAP